MQLEVIGRVIDSKQEELKGLVTETSVHISHANGQLASQPLPSLPNEVLAQIFRSLYFIEGRDTGLRLWDNTVWKLVDDKRTPSTFRRIIRSEIPVVVTQAEIGRSCSELNLPEVQVLLGKQPRAFQPQQLDNIISPSSSTTMMITAEGWPELKEGLHDLCRIPWRCLIFAHDSNEYCAKLKLPMVNTVIHECGHKLADLDRLVVIPFEISESDDELRAGDPLIKNLEQYVPRIRAASLSLRLLLLPGLRHFLSRVTDLEVSIPCVALDANF